MGRRDEDADAGRRHARHRASSPPRKQDEEAREDEQAIRSKLRESGWKKRHVDDVSAEPLPDPTKPEKSSSRAPEDRRSARSSRRLRSPRRRERGRRKTSSRRRSTSRSASRSRSRSRSTGRRRRRHASSHKRRSRSTSRGRETLKKPRRASTSLSPSSRPTSEEVKKEVKEKEDEDETETENEEEVAEEKDKEDAKEDKEKDKKEDVPRRKPPSSRKSSRRSRSGSPRSPSRSARRRRHRRNSYSRSRSVSRSRRPRRGGSRSRSRSAPRDRRSRGRDRDRRSRRRGRSFSRSRSRSFSSARRRRRDRSSSRDRPRRDANSSPEPHQHPPAAADAAPTAPIAPGVAPAATGGAVNPTITQLMAQYPTMSLQDIIAKMQASNVTMAAAVAQKPARELYVGNLPTNVTGPQLQEFLGTIIQQVGLTTSPGNPIMNTWISTDGHFAFCEMRTVEECNLALLLNQLSLLGQPLKFGRPRSFMGPPQPMPQISARAQTALANLGCTPNPAWFAQPAIPSIPSVSSELTTSMVVLTAPTATVAQPAESSHNNCLVMMNIPVVLTEDQVKELVQPFGALKSFSLVKDTSTGASMGSALFEYEDDSVTDSAVAGLNGLDIGGILLSVQRQPHSGALPPVGASASTAEEQTSAVLKMANMVSVDELRDDEEYADLAEDVEEECKRFGNVAYMEIPRPKDGEDVPGVGCIYVRFEKEADAISALKALSGRKFGGNIVKVTYFPVDKFEKHEFS